MTPERTKEEILNECFVNIGTLKTVFMADGPGKGSLGDRILKAMEEYKSQCSPVESKWVSVKERLPKYGQRVLTYNPTNEISDEEIRVIMYGSVAGGFPSSVTHWQPLPELPSPTIEETKEK